MLLYTAIGDAYGAAYEFIPHDEWKVPNTGNHYSKHPVLEIGNGKYTDDAQMTLAVVEAMVNETRTKSPMGPIKWADYFHNAYSRDPRPGYSSGFEKILQETADGQELQNIIVPNSTRSGAVMRAAPIGGFKHVNAVISQATEQARVTHDTPIAIECSRAIALASHFLIYKVGHRDELGEFVNKFLGHSRTVDWTEDRREWASVEAVDCARNAITAWRNSTTATEVLINSVAPGGDTDTVASIAMSLAWADPSIRDDLSLNMFNDLEVGPFGFQYLFDATHKYVERFCK